MLGQIDDSRNFIGRERCSRLRRSRGKQWEGGRGGTYFYRGGGGREGESWLLGSMERGVGEGEGKEHWMAILLNSCSGEGGGA